MMLLIFLCRMVSLYRMWMCVVGLMLLIGMDVSFV